MLFSSALALPMSIEHSPRSEQLSSSGEQTLNVRYSAQSPSNNSTGGVLSEKSEDSLNFSGFLSLALDDQQVAVEEDISKHSDFTKVGKKIKHNSSSLNKAQDLFCSFPGLSVFPKSEKSDNIKQNEQKDSLQIEPDDNELLFKNDRTPNNSKQSKKKESNKNVLQLNKSANVTSTSLKRAQTATIYKSKKQRNRQRNHITSKPNSKQKKIIVKKRKTETKNWTPLAK